MGMMNTNNPGLYSVDKAACAIEDFACLGDIEGLYTLAKAFQARGQADLERAAIYRASAVKARLKGKTEWALRREEDSENALQIAWQKYR